MCLLFPLSRGRQASNASAVSIESGFRDTRPPEPNIDQCSARAAAAPSYFASSRGSEGTAAAAALVATEGEEEEGAEEEGAEEEEVEEEEAGDVESVAVAVLRSSDALDLSAAARQLGWPRARLAPRSAVPRLLRWRFAPGGVPPLGHAEGVETLVCSSVVVGPARGEERGGEEGDGGGGPSGGGVSFVAGGGGPALRLVFRGRGALAAAMQAEGAAVVVGLGVERPPLVLPLPPLAAAAAAADSSSAGEGADGPSASSPSAAAPPQGGPAYSSPPPLFVDDAAGVRAVAELLLPPLRQPSGEEAPTTTEESGGARGTSVGTCLLYTSPSPRD